MNCIEVEMATKVYKETVALKSVSIDFECGKIHGIVGRNGSGKTVLLKAICGLILLSEGEIRVNGLKIGKDVDIPKGIGMIIENPGFLPTYSAYGNLKLLAAIRHKIKKQDIYDVLHRVGLDAKSSKHVGKYSLGMRQRLGIAQAIMEDPDILILDEPMNGLDNKGVADIRELLISLREEGKTILLASHSVEDIRILCDTVCMMDAGELTKQNKANW